MTETALQFQEYLKKINHYTRVMTLLDWDLYTATPKQGYEGMAETLSYFAGKQFSLSTSPELLSLLEKLLVPEEYEQLSPGYRFTVKTMLRDLKKEQNIPESFVSSFVQETSRSRKAWEEAKNSENYALFAPHLDKVIEMVTERCSYTDPGKDPYEVLLDRFEEGMDSKTIDQVFSELKDGLLPLLDQILSSPQPDTNIYDGFYDPDDQKKVQEFLLKYIGFSFEKGTTGESEHPFTIGFSRNDVRVTNHYHIHDPLSAMFSAIHEGGHAIFQQNADPSLDGTPAADCPYMGIHESQSRFFENILARRESFWKPIYTQIQTLLPDLKKITLTEFVREINHIRNSFIRTEADEVTYALHVILRYEMEQEIFRNKRCAAELPVLWNEKMDHYLHLIPSSPSEGILQDMHWSDGSFGYFPSYLLGTIYDGMFLEAMEKDLGPIDPILERGDIIVITKWLNEKIHQFGSTRLPKEVIEKVCGKPLSALPILNYFREKYSRIYGF